MTDDELKEIELSEDSGQLSVGLTMSKKKNFGKSFGLIVGGVCLVILVAVVVGWLQLKPRNTETVVITVNSGDSANSIVDQLVAKKVFSNALTVKLYLKLTNQNPALQIGEHQVQPGLSGVSEVFNLLTKQIDNTQNVNFYPGATLNFRHSATDTTPSHREALQSAGYNDQQIDEAFAQYRDHELFMMLPGAQNLEGLIFADLFNVYKRATVEEVLARSFDEYVDIIKKYDLKKAYEQQGLTLYQGIILASIVEREVYKDDDRPIVAQVFLKRWREGAKLGSDVTYQYASRLAGVENDLYIDSPYNTRQNAGLPPTPIASPSLKSLLAVANPAETNYLYFVAGDDEQTYFAETYEQHSRNVQQYCIKKCAVY